MTIEQVLAACRQVNEKITGLYIAPDGDGWEVEAGAYDDGDWIDELRAIGATPDAAVQALGEQAVVTLHERFEKAAAALAAVDIAPRKS